MNRCSPNYADQTISCFNKDALLKIVKAYNSRNLDPIKISKNHNKYDIWEGIQQKMSQKCGKDETCWLEQPFLKNNPELNNFFKPLAPLGRYQWLSTDDIFNVMTQYDEKYPDFKFVGPLPMDFLTLSDPDSKFLQNLDLNKIPEKQIGIIFNMDPSTQSGSHWIALNIDRQKNEIHYFDSYGDKHYFRNQYKLPYYDSNQQYHRGEEISLPPNIQKFIFQLMKRLIPDKELLNQSGGSIKMPYKLKINTIQHQYANSECGVYSMLFLLKSRSNSFENITRQIITDEAVNKYRDTLFRRK